MKVILGQYPKEYCTSDLEGLYRKYIRRLDYNSEAPEDKMEIRLAKFDRVIQVFLDVTLNKILQFNKRTEIVRIDRSDTLDLYTDLAQIIHPALIEFKKRNDGCFEVKPEDCPFSVNDESDTGFSEQRYNWVMDEMIWTFNEVLNDLSQEKFWSGESDFFFEDILDTTKQRVVKGPNHTRVFDSEAFGQHKARVDNGLRLFGVYYLNLWI